VIIWVALAQNQTGKLDLGMFASYLVALLTLLDRLKSLSGINAAIQRGLARRREHLRPARSRRGAGHGHRRRCRARAASSSSTASPALPGTGARGAGRRLADDPARRNGGARRQLGSGKTSLVNLIPRFYEPTAGRLFIDGHDVTTLTLASLRAQIALVSQDVMLFDDTIAANIAYGAMSGTPPRTSSARRRRARARVHPRDAAGFETEVGENGVRLSGGQRQRPGDRPRDPQGRRRS
jgi:subfamily B ATP-binding cassette protein MsbA